MATSCSSTTSSTTTLANHNLSPAGHQANATVDNLSFFPPQIIYLIISKMTISSVGTLARTNIKWLNFLGPENFDENGCIWKILLVRDKAFLERRSHTEVKVPNDLRLCKYVYMFHLLPPNHPIKRLLSLSANSPNLAWHNIKKPQIQTLQLAQALEITKSIENDKVRDPYLSNISKYFAREGLPQDAVKVVNMITNGDFKDRSLISLACTFFIQDNDNLAIELCNKTQNNKIKAEELMKLSDYFRGNLNNLPKAEKIAMLIPDEPNKPYSGYKKWCLYNIVQTYLGKLVFSPFSDTFLKIQSPAPSTNLCNPKQAKKVALLIPDDNLKNKALQEIEIALSKAPQIID